MCISPRVYCNDCGNIIFDGEAHWIYSSEIQNCVPASLLFENTCLSQYIHVLVIFITIAGEALWYRQNQADMYIGPINGPVTKTFIDKPAA